MIDEMRKRRFRWEGKHHHHQHLRIPCGSDTFEKRSEAFWDGWMDGMRRRFFVGESIFISIIISIYENFGGKRASERERERENGKFGVFFSLLVMMTTTHTHTKSPSLMT
jgi:hypothetical protein